MSWQRSPESTFCAHISTSRPIRTRSPVGHIGVEAVLRLFIEHDANPQAFYALVRFLDLLEPVGREIERRPAEDPLALSFQLKLLWLAGYLPHLTDCAGCGSAAPLVAFSAAAGGAVCRSCSTAAIPVSVAGFAGIRWLLERPLAEARSIDLPAAPAREALRVVEAVYEYHGGFRMRTLAGR